MGFETQALNFATKYSDVIGNSVKGASSIAGYVAQNAAARQTEKANRNMLLAAEQEAALAQADAAQKADAYRRDAARTRSQQVAAYLKSGVTLDGSPMLVTDQTTAMGEQNAQNIITNSQYQQNATRLRAQANQKMVTKGNLFGTAADALGSFAKAKYAYENL